METTVAFLRVVGSSIKPFTYRGGDVGEVSLIKANGGVGVGHEQFPASFHYQTPPGETISTPTGDWIKVTIERMSAEEMQAISPGYLALAVVKS